MQHKLFALSLGFAGLILATHHAFAAAPPAGAPVLARAAAAAGPV